MKKISIIGGGSAALILGAQIDTKKYKVTIFDQKKKVGRKFLVAGEGGLNLTFNSDLDSFINKYFPSNFIKPILRKFSNKDFIDWLNALDIPTFIGSSNRVFPDLNQKPIEVLNKIVEAVANNNVKFQLDTKWIGWNESGDLCFENLEDVNSDITVFALGGASWKVTGSDSKWSDIFKNKGINIVPFKAANCAFEVIWHKDFINLHEGKPLKNIALSYKNHFSKGELVVSKFGLEGNAIYALSQKIQENLSKENDVVIHLDLKPTMTVAQIKAKLKNSKNSKVTDLLKRVLKLDRTAIGLLKQFTDRNTFSNLDLLAKIIKNVPITLKSSEEINKAISTLGGISLDEIDDNLQFKKFPNSYAIGEMLDWYAPTGGYLLQACFSMGFVLANHLNDLE
ncbi:NAD(P)/FAD-dependent oxidoreductase [Polaribacter sp. Asnod1-A03]|uniref:NAD(P)/FAD-dependent oxidoreductase n=1 Tax=Polaribacter sp. Asnod1-A03 TaxID=3160581 RepID=UPI00386C77B4